MTRRVPRATAVLGLALAGCAYYNGMWSAERLARDARRQEARGLTAEARLSWGRAATKAESVLVHHPSSRWADDALVLQGEALAWSGACPAAAKPLARALREVNDAALRERAALAAATCALSQGAAERAERLLGAVIGSRDGRRGSTASYLAGRAAVLRGEPAEAAERFAHSDLPEAASARVGALAAAGRPRDAVALLDSVARRDDDESRWTDALADIARTGGVETAAEALDRLLARGKLRAGPRARLLIADGDRQRQARRFVQAAARYAAAASLVPDSAEAGVARVHALLADIAQLAAPGQLDSVADRLEGLTRSISGAAPAELRDLTRWIADARSADTSEIAAFRSAERVRDSLAAPDLAAALFRRFAVRHPGSIFAPKALIAAGQLQPETLDSVEVVLRARYADSPYALAFHGAASPAFQAAEDSLALALGVGRVVAFTIRPLDEIQVAPPRTGPRGPELDPPAVERRAGRVVPGPRRPVPVRRQDDRPKPRPAERPDERP